MIKEWLNGDYYIETIALIGIFIGGLFIWQIVMSFV